VPQRGYYGKIAKVAQVVARGHPDNDSEEEGSLSEEDSSIPSPKASPKK
jgi:hypothetical protein